MADLPRACDTSGADRLAPGLRPVKSQEDTPDGRFEWAVPLTSEARREFREKTAKDSYRPFPGLGDEAAAETTGPDSNGATLVYVAVRKANALIVVARISKQPGQQIVAASGQFARTVAANLEPA